MTIITGDLDIRHVGGKDWRLLKTLTVCWRDREFYVMEGFVCDLTSKWSKVGNEVKAAVAHDHLYRGNEAGWTRKEADQLFLDAMEEDGVSWITRRSYYRAVRMFGMFSWKG